MSAQDYFFASGCEGGRLVALHGYFDDSGDGSGRQWISIGGAVAPKENWEFLERRWRKATAECQESFHATDCEAGRGCCNGWPVEKRTLLMRKLVDAIISCGIGVFGTTLPIRDYLNVFGGSKDDAYLLAFKHALFNMAIQGRYAQEHGHGEEVFVCHESGQHDQKILSAFKEMMGADWEFSRHLQSLNIGRKTQVGLQVADLVARETFKFFDNQSSNRPIRKPVIRLVQPANSLFFFCWSRGGFEELKTYGGPNNLE
ncbi:MAG: hypothetical protein ABSH22_21275, partial [Tepidisphaeraceae bacterium]